MLICLKLQRNATENGSSNIKDQSTERLQLQIPVLHQSVDICKGYLLGARHVWAEYKGRVTDVSECHRNIVIPNPSYQNLKICVSKVQKNYSKIHECVSAQQLQNFEISMEAFSSNYEILFPILNTFTVDIEEYSLDVN